MRVLVLCGCLVGCGSPTSNADGGTGDGPDPDSSVQPGQIRVTVLIARSSTEPEPVPRVGDDIVFSDNTQTQVVQTDANGQATATVSGTATITHVQHLNSLTVVLESVFGVMPGEDILLRQPAADYTTHAAMMVNFPQTGANYDICNACSCATSMTSPVSLEMFEHCQSNPDTITLFEFQSMQPTAYVSTTASYDRVSGGTATMPAQLVPMEQHTGTFTNIPSRLTSIVFDFVAGRKQMRSTIMSPGASATTQVPGWSGMPARFSTTFLDADGDGENQVAMMDVESATSAQEIDVGAFLLPWLNAPTFDRNTRTFAAPFSAGAAPDLFVGDVGYVNQNNMSLTWTLFAAAPGTFVLPDIPASVVDTTPGPTTFPLASYAIAAESIDGYAEARLDPHRVWRQLISTPGSGTIRMSRSPGAR